MLICNGKSRSPQWNCMRKRIYELNRLVKATLGEQCGRGLNSLNFHLGDPVVKKLRGLKV